jgi:hypothetical protein
MPSGVRSDALLSTGYGMVEGAFAATDRPNASLSAWS